MATRALGLQETLDSPLEENGNLRGVLLSIHLTSNRPDNFVTFLDRLEQTTDDMKSVEVAVKIDEDDAAMNALLPQEAKRRPFKITFISTPLSGGFYGLWRAYDDILRACDPYAYFIIGLNDEMYFTEKGWDTRLRKYVNLYPDHIYRLRTSIHRERNYYDFWEASCAGDLTAIMTRRWLSMGGGWCPCNGPDSFQSAVAFYFGFLYRHDTFNRPYRERVVHDIEFGAYGANLDLTSPEVLRRRMRGGVIAWYELMSYPMQQDAARRAQKLHANIWAIAHGLSNYEVQDDPKLLVIRVFDRIANGVAWQRSYRISRMFISGSNFLRKFRYPYYGGAGELYRRFTLSNAAYYFLLRHERLDRLNMARATAVADARASNLSADDVFSSVRRNGYSWSQLVIYAWVFLWTSVRSRKK